MRIPRWAIAVGLALLATILVTTCQRDVGVARDETVYMHHGSQYADWWLGLVTGDRSVGEQAIEKVWGGRDPTANNREHPPLMKTAFGLSETILHDQLGLASELTAYRFPSAVLWGVLVALVFAFTCAVWGRTEGVVAALLVMLLPRGVFHAGLACFDAPITTLWFATVVAYWQALRRPRWSWTVGVAFGLALATKHNAIILPFVILAHHAWLCARARTWKVQPWAPAALLLGPLVLYVLWPWLWHAPIAHARDWIGFHLHHTHYNFEYLGENWNHPPFPWHVAIVTTLVTVPVITIAAGLVGTGVLIARRREATPHAPGVLIALSLAASMGPFFLGSTPIFGAEKHWMPAIPSLCIAAAIGLVWAARRASAAWPRVQPAVAIGVVSAVAVLASATELRQSHPYALSSYNALAGGAPGGADLGMNRQFWGVAARGVIPWLRTQPPGPVYSHDASPAWGLYQKWGMLPKGYRDSGREEAGIAKSRHALVVHELHFNRHDYLIWDSYGTVRPSYVLLADGVPIVTVYSRP